jgi:hypothetical protein
LKGKRNAIATNCERMRLDACISGIETSALGRLRRKAADIGGMGRLLDFLNKAKEESANQIRMQAAT